MFKQRVHISRNKILLIISLMTDLSLDVLFITEARLSQIFTPHIAELNHPPYHFIHHHLTPHILEAASAFYINQPSYLLMLSNIHSHTLKLLPVPITRLIPILSTYPYFIDHHPILSR